MPRVLLLTQTGSCAHLGVCKFSTAQHSDASTARPTTDLANRGVNPGGWCCCDPGTDGSTTHSPSTSTWEVRSLPGGGECLQLRIRTGINWGDRYAAGVQTIELKFETQWRRAWLLALVLG